MKRLLTALVIAAIAIAGVCSVSQAGPNLNAAIGLHLLATTEKNACTRTEARPACGMERTHGDLYPATYFAYVLVMDGTTQAGIAGVQFGISYGSGLTDQVGIDIWAWTLCGTLEFQQPSPVWPADGGGNMVTWDYVNACQRYVPPGADPNYGVVANAGFFYLGAYSPADLSITARPVDGYAKVASCAAEEDIIQGPGDGTPQNPPVVHIPSHLGVAGFGPARYGYTPCGGDPVEQTTWSGIKSLYGRR